MPRSIKHPDKQPPTRSLPGQIDNSTPREEEPADKPVSISLLIPPVTHLPPTVEDLHHPPPPPRAPSLTLASYQLDTTAASPKLDGLLWGMSRFPRVAP